MGTERQRSSPSRWRDEEGWAGDTAGVFLGCEPVRRHPPAVALPSWRRHSRTTAAVPTLSLPPFEGVSPPRAPFGSAVVRSRPADGARPSRRYQAQAAVTYLNSRRDTECGKRGGGGGADREM